MQVKIRLYQDDDFKEYVAVLAQTWPRVGSESEEIVRERLKTLDEKGEQIWVAETGGRPAGFMLIYFENPPTPAEMELEGEWLVVDWLDVHPDFQRKGLGTLLLKKAEEIAKNRNVSSIYTVTSIDDEKMLGFSEKNHFKKGKRIKDFWGAGTGDAFLLTKTVRT